MMQSQALADRSRPSQPTTHGDHEEGEFCPTCSDKELVRRIKNFRDRMRRTVVLENISTQITEDVIKSALSQFGTVVGVEILTSLVDPMEQGLGRALVEIQSVENAKNVVRQLGRFLFQVQGMPRPASARIATEGFFTDSPVPAKPPKRQGRLVRRGYPGAEAIFRWRDLLWKHDQQARCLKKFQTDEKEKMAREQEEQMGKYYQVLQGMFEAKLQNMQCAYGNNLPDGGNLRPYASPDANLRSFASPDGNLRSFAPPNLVRTWTS